MGKTRKAAAAGRNKGGGGGGGGRSKRSKQEMEKTQAEESHDDDDFFLYELYQYLLDLTPVTNFHNMDKHPICVDFFLKKKETMISPPPVASSDTAAAATAASHHHHATSSTSSTTAHHPTSHTRTTTSSSNSSTEQEIITYAWVLATHAIHKLLVKSNSSKSTTDTVAANAVVGTYLAGAMLHSIPMKKLEKLHHAASRQILGQALLVAATSAVRGLRQIPELGLAVLDQTVFSSSGNNKNYFWDDTRDAILSNLLKRDCPDLYEMVVQHNTTGGNDNHDDWWKEERICLQALRDKKPPHYINDVFSNILLDGEMPNLHSEGRLALKRYTAVSLTWYGQAQEILIKVALDWLQQGITITGDDLSGKRTIVIDEHLQESKTPKGPKKKLQTTVTVPVPDNVTKIALVCKICSLIHDMGHHAGTRPPSAHGGLDIYLKKLWKVKKASVSKSDLRSYAVMVVYHLIEAHTECLQENFDGSKMKIVNEDAANAMRSKRVLVSNSSSSSKPKGNNKANNNNIDRRPYESLYLYYPFVHKALIYIAQATGSNYNLTSFQVRCRDRIEYAAAAYVMNRVQESRPLDAQLVQFAVSRLVICLNIKDNPNDVSSTNSVSSGGNRPDYKLDEPLPVPSLPATATTRTRKRKTPAESSHGSFAGLFDTSKEDRFPGDEKISLFVRAGDLFPTLLSIVERCYDTRVVEEPPTTPAASSPEATSSESAEGKKRKATQTGRASKRRKRSGKKKAEEESVDSDLPYTPIKNARANLASTTLEAMQSYLRDPVLESSLTKAQSLLRSFVTMEDMHRIVDLCPILDEVIIKTRERIATTAKETNVAICWDSSDTSFSNPEKTVWSAHMNMCLVLARGRVAYSERRTPCLGDSRLALYKYIAGQTDRISRDSSAWPLCLPPAHRVLLSANLTSEDFTSGSSNEADRLIVDGLLKELSCILEDPKLLQKYTKPVGEFFASENLPLSLHDVRIFLLAMSRLASQEQASRLASLLSSVEKGIRLLKQMDRDDFQLNQVSSFFARVVTLCVNAYIVVKFGYSARAALFDVVGKYLSTIVPTLRSRSEWYYLERSFMGVFLNWEDSELPSMHVPSITVKDQVEATLRRVLNEAWAFGFESARFDNCHLLFASWNALGKSDLWNTVPLKIAMHSHLPEDLPSLLTELRDEICLVHRKVKKLQGSSPQSSTLIKCIEAKENSRRSTTTADAKKLVKDMIKKASNLVNELLSRFVPSDDSMDQEIPPVVFCLFESCAVYLSFAVSCFTKPRCDFFTATMASIGDRSRTRSYSTDSEAMNSDAGSADSQEVLADALERLQDVCEHIGAAPAHPDWLDTDCQLWGSFSTDEAAAAAHDAQICLTKLIAVALTQSRLSRRQAIRKVVDRRGDNGQVILAERLCWLDQWETEDSAEFISYIYSKGERMYKTDVGIACSVNEDFLNLMLKEVARNVRESSCANWCPHAAQRVLGRLQDCYRSQLATETDSPELRSSGEWEVLLSSTLTSAGLCFSKDDRSDAIAESAYGCLVDFERWTGVCSGAMDALVPVTALLRFGLCGSGRMPHPLSKLDLATDDFDPETAIDDGLPDDINAPQPIKDDIVKTLGTVARYPFRGATSEFVAAHLLEDPSDFEFLRGMEASTSALQALAELHGVVLAHNSASEAAPFLLERLAAVLDLYGRDDSDSTRDELSGMPLRIFACLQPLSAIKVLVLNTIASKEVRISTVLSGSYSIAALSDAWDWAGSNSRYVRALLVFILQEASPRHTRVRAFFARITALLIRLEKQSGNPHLLSPIISAFNDLPEEQIGKLLMEDVCGKNLPGDLQLAKFHESLCSVLAFLLGSRGCSMGFQRADFVFATLEKAFDSWKDYETAQRQLILELTLLYACRTCKVFDVGVRLVRDLKSRQKQKASDRNALESVKVFSNFLAEMHGVLSKASSSSESDQAHGDVSVSHLPESCSYSTKKDFHDQHWYNCHTCGLTSDKGCCTLCALVCHEGHEVSYARYSSFFCDCGGAEESSESDGQVKCKCLDARARDKFLMRRHGSEQDDTLKIERKQMPVTLMSAKICAAIVKDSFPQDGQRSLNSLSDKGKGTAWIRFLFEYTKKKFEKWRAQIDNEGIFFFAEQKQNCPYGWLSENFSTAALNKPPKLGRLSYQSFCYQGVSHTGSFQAKISNDLTVERTKKNRLENNGITRSIMDADSRGRIVIAEPAGLIFCTGLRSGMESFPRASVSIVGSVPVGTRVVGVKFSRVNENAVLVWGTDDAKIIFMNGSLTASTQSVTLDVGLPTDDTASDIIVDCDWMWGSSELVVVGRRRSLRVFDLSLKKPSASPSLVVSADACPSDIRDFAVVPCTEKNSVGSDCDRTWKIFVLLQTGHLCEIVIRRSDVGELSADSELDTGVDPLSNELIKTPPVSSVQSKKDSLVYMSQSSLLLYQTNATGAVAILLDESGKTNGYFELLPKEIPSAAIQLLDESKVTGPFCHWKELGIVRRGSYNFFRVSCTARSTTNQEPLLLILEFNGSNIFVRENTRTTSSGWFDPPQSYEGVLAFSAPFCQDDPASCDILGTKKFVERMFLCSLTQNGCLYVHAEEQATPVRPLLQPSYLSDHYRSDAAAPEPCFDLLAFENLVDITESEAVVFVADGVSEIKSKIVGESEKFLMSPRREGLSLIVFVNKQGEDCLAPESRCSYADKQETDYVIAAVRLLVGSTSRELVPRSVKIMGRSLHLKEGEKRWYSFVLTAQEIAMSVRNGFVTIEIGPCYDSTNNPLVDAIEIHGIERSKIGRWLPGYLESFAASASLTGGIFDPTPPTTADDCFRLSLVALASLKNIVGAFKPNRTEKAFLKVLVQETALGSDREIEKAVFRLVSSLEHDEETRQSFHDKAVLSGCSLFLRKCYMAFQSEEYKEGSAKSYRLWRSLSPVLRTCLQTAATIAKLRPFNYLQAADETPQAVESSIAADAAKFIPACLRTTISGSDVVRDFVDLSLLETAVANGSPRGRFGSFEGLRSLLMSPNHYVVKQACAAISSFCQGSDRIFAAQTMAIKYVCDSCLLFINDIRYTLLEEDHADHAFDLCPDCYKLATDYVSSADRSDELDVFIRGASVGESPKLSCGDVKKLQPVQIQKPRTDDETSRLDSSEDNKNEPPVVEHPSSEAQVDLGTVAEVAHTQQLFDDFMEGLFAGIADLLAEELKKQKSVPDSLVWLSVDLVRHSMRTGRRVDRSKNLVTAMAVGLHARLQSALNNDVILDDSLVLLEGLSCLFAPDKKVREFFSGIETDYTSHVGEVSVAFKSTNCLHAFPGVARKFTKGRHKNRVFISCGQNERCNFFQWGDQVGSDKKPVNALFNDGIATLVWELLTSPLMQNTRPLHSVLRVFVEKQMELLVDPSDNDKSHESVEDRIRFCSVDMGKDVPDGILCSVGRLQNDSALEARTAKRHRKSYDAFRYDSMMKESLAANALELMALAGRTKPEAVSEWFPVLCKTIMSEKKEGSTANGLCLLAKRCLWKLCGESAAESRAVQDYFAFSFQFEKLLTSTRELLEYCAVLKEKARQCSPTWKTSEPVTFFDLRMKDLVGTESLVSENVCTLARNEAASKILGELWASASTRAVNWRLFCGMRKMPDRPPDSRDIFAAPPVLCLTAILCSIAPEHQAKVLRLLSLALSKPKDAVVPSQEADATRNLTTNPNENEKLTSGSDKTSLALFYSENKLPEEMLDVTVDAVYAFVMRFVLRGSTSEVRSLSSSVAVRLCRCLDKKGLGILLRRLLGNPLDYVGVTGKRSADFLGLLQSLLRLAGPKAIDVNRCAILVQAHLKQQLLAIRHDRANGEFMNFEMRTSSSIQKKRYDLAKCVSCRLHTPRTKETATDKSSSNAGGERAASSSRSRSSSSKSTKWLPEQVSPFSRGRLITSRDSCVSNEFCSFFVLKNRSIVSALNVEIDNPRRFVKTINIYFSPRPVEDASVLKSETFADAWQPCGTLTLSRGCSRSSLTLTAPVVASNLKIEYFDFYERPDSKSSDGSMVIHCPRCARAVTNAHGVCSNCGEVAFQCRKCRHINYERLDAFLCAECGYCASGSFQFEMTAATASNAVAITNDADFERASQMLQTASRLHSELRAALMQKLTITIRGRKKPNSGHDDDKETGSAAIRRIFEGQNPMGETEEFNDYSKLKLNQLGKQGSIVRMIASRQVGDQSPISLLRTGRQLRSDTDSGRLESLMIRGLDEEESTSDFLGGLLEGSGGLSRFASLDPGDPLSRLLASVQSRREQQQQQQQRNRTSEVADASNEGQSSHQRGKDSGNSVKETLEVCDRLYALMREAEREVYELERRCEAWGRLNNGQLAETGQEEKSASAFEPSHCSVCAAVVALHILILWLRLFQLGPNAVVISKEFITMLLNEDATVHLKNLQETKRATIKEIALKSQEGSTLVLEALRLRLMLLQDINSAEILGKILESAGDTPMGAPFVALARESLEANVM